MKKILYSFFALMLAVCSLASCDDVPAPYQIPGIGGDEGGDNPAVTGDGSVDNPFNCAGIIAFTESLGSDVESAEMVYMKGKVYSITENFDGGFGNATFYIADDENGTNKFYAYRVYYLDNKKYTSGDVLKVGDEVVICAKVVNYKGNTPETVQNAGYVYSINGKGGSTSGGDEGEAKGDGSQANPYNSVGASKYAQSLGSDVESPEAVYIKGKVASIVENYNGGFGNATFYISDDGTDKGQFYVYRISYLENKKYTSGDLLKVGDEVVIYSKVMNYKGNTPETVQNAGYLYSLNGKTSAGTGGGSEVTGEAKGDGTLENPYNSVAANKKASELASGEKSDVVYIKGIVVSVKEQYGTLYGNASFYISDDGKSANQFYVFRALYLNNEKYTSGTLLAPGDEVVICGKLTNYMGNTPETATGEAYLYSLKSNGGSTGGGDNPGGGDEPPVTNDNLIANGGFESWTGGTPDNWKSASTASNATLSQSTDAHSGSYSVSVGFNTSQNKRLAYKEITLKAGTYNISFYAKSTTADKSQCQPGWVAVTDGKVGNYNYLGYESLTNTSWTHVTKSFTLDATTTLCVVVMNPKSSNYAVAQDILIDDFTLSTTDGGIE